jgi:hypothetical protein
MTMHVENLDTLITDLERVESGEIDFDFDMTECTRTDCGCISTFIRFEYGGCGSDSWWNIEQYLEIDEQTAQWVWSVHESCLWPETASVEDVGVAIGILKQLREMGETAFVELLGGTL